MLNESADLIQAPLMGSDEATIDDKGRVLVSKRNRDRLGTPFVLALGDRGCVVAYPQWAWRSLLDAIRQADPNNQGRRDYTRLLLGDAEDGIKFDGQGRMVIPRTLREKGGLKDKLQLVGCGDRLEVWAADQYQLYLKAKDTYASERIADWVKAYRDMTGRAI